jgi:UDP-N-acetylglucosamine 1-carboxyvinyltransferase
VEVLGDRIEAASWASLAAASDGDITVRGIRPDTLGNIVPRLAAMNLKIERVVL